MEGRGLNFLKGSRDRRGESLILKEKKNKINKRKDLYMYIYKKKGKG